jgi:hypothetical protein
VRETNRIASRLILLTLIQFANEWLFVHFTIRIKKRPTGHLVGRLSRMFAGKQRDQITVRRLSCPSFPASKLKLPVS